MGLILEKAHRAAVGTHGNAVGFPDSTTNLRK
jgi:hypothetical protein